MVNLVKSSFISSLSFSLRISSSFLLLVYFYNFYDSTINETVSIAYFYALIGIIVSDFGIQNYIQSTYSENDYDNDQLFSYLLSFKIGFILFLNIVVIFSILLLSNLNIQDVIIIILISNSIAIMNILEISFLKNRLTSDIRKELKYSVFSLLILLPLLGINNILLSSIYLLLSRLIFIFIIIKRNIKTRIVNIFIELKGIYLKVKYFLLDNIALLITINLDQLLIFFFLGSLSYKDYLPYSRVVIIIISLIGILLPIILKPNLKIKGSPKFLKILVFYTTASFLILCLPIIYTLHNLVPAVFSNINPLHDASVVSLMLIILFRFLLGGTGFFLTVNGYQKQRFLSNMYSILVLLVLILFYPLHNIQNVLSLLVIFTLLVLSLYSINIIRMIYAKK